MSQSNLFRGMTIALAAMLLIPLAVIVLIYLAMLLGIIVGVLP